LIVNGEILPLTSLRGLGAVWVLLYHTYEAYDWFSFGTVFLQRGYLGVDVFFTLSGFIIVLSHSASFNFKPRRQIYITFLVKRIARVWPLYAFCTIWYSALFAFGFGSNHISLTTLRFLLPINLAMIQEWHLGQSIVRPGWSISAEFAAYLLFPILLQLAVRSRNVLAIACAIVAFSLLAVVGGPGGIGDGTINVWAPDSFWPLVRCLSEFTLGMLAYRVFRAHANWKGVAARWALWITSPWALWITIGTLVGLGYMQNTDLLIVLMLPLFLVQLAKTDSALTGILTLRPFVFLGRISYAIYLTHWAFLPAIRGERSFEGWIGPRLAHIVTLVAVYSALLMTATVLYYVVEKPSRRRIMSLFLKTKWGAPAVNRFDNLSLEGTGKPSAH
jgi:peptidoglycan/LPS O-acetylase OafA/YrhL